MANEKELTSRELERQADALLAAAKSGKKGEEEPPPGSHRRGGQKGRYSPPGR